LAVLNFFVSAALFFNQYVNPIALEALAWKYYFVYIGVLIVSIICIYFFYPETRGRMLEEVAEIFDGPGAVPPVARAHDEALEDDADYKGEKDETERVEDVNRL
jgi:hypothetical protein